MLYLGADHNGYFLKERLKLFLDHARIQWQDMGAFKRQKSDDYVDFAVLVGKAVKKGGMGLLVCGSGHGMVIAANKISGVRAIMPLSARSARDGRHDDHANVLVLAGWEVPEASAKKIVAAFIKQKPGKSPRYLRRLKKVRKLEA